MSEMPEKSEDVLRDDYVAALNQRIRAETNLATFLASRGTHLTPERLKDFNHLLEIDKHAEEELARARQAYENYQRGLTFESI